ncbi:hypothetical protein [Paraburkholderia adhaesiva]|uniref:hypothetical protein n=1 Tax=Paraburkholderia adhaesiva TaxID=2883244 RepID=UPI001F2654EE|nr:hypothetical protein [Paraburkholderia adhaesiva]
MAQALVEVGRREAVVPAPAEVGRVAGIGPQVLVGVVVGLAVAIAHPVLVAAPAVEVGAEVVEVAAGPSRHAVVVAVDPAGDARRCAACRTP